MSSSDRCGPYRALVVEGGAGLRVLSQEGRQLLDGSAVDALPDGARGEVLAPWPNRLRDGRWELGGRARRGPPGPPGQTLQLRWGLLNGGPS